ncbi:LCP family protein [Streptomyces inusitatus]|uniref:LCP family protein n=1 Tax=Streptomyces inusitatus TaxID=68221 RepID=UPI00167D176F|nr:LCP family protein [Streptomyces inusitatus]
MGRNSARGSQSPDRVPRARDTGPAGGGTVPGPRGGRPPGGGDRPPRRGKRRVLRWTAAVLSLLILATAAAGYLYYENLNGKIKKKELTLGAKMPVHRANADGQTPLNILLIGSDARDNEANQKLGGAKETFNGKPLADVQMLLHVSADRSNISVISMPRDTMLRIPECQDPETGEVHPARAWAQTNESLSRGGPGCTVATWYELTGITIDHFMLIDFAGVVSMADAIGGVPVCVSDRVHSRNSKGQGSGLKLDAGTSFVKGEQALQWLRTRYGFEDGTDLARARAQHMYMNSMVRQLRKNAKLTDPNKLRKLAEAAIDSLTVDKGIESVASLLDLGNALKSVPTHRITMAKMPSVYSKRPNYTGKVEPKPGEAEQVFRMIREDIPLDGKGKPKKKKAAPAKSQDRAAAPADIPVQVRNGTGGDGQLPLRGRATEVTAALQAGGFTQAVADIAGNPQRKTVVQFSNAELEGDAQAVAKALGIPVSSVRKSTDVTGISLTVGADWPTGDAFPGAVDGDKTPDSAEALNGSDTKACMKVQPGFTW